MMNGGENLVAFMVMIMNIQNMIMMMQIKSLWVFWIELKLNDGDVECWLFKADMLDFVVETFIEHQLIDTFEEN